MRLRPGLLRELSQPTVSHHLRVLREAGVVSGERRGTWVHYSLMPEAVAQLRVLAQGLEPAGSRSASDLGGRRLRVCWRERTGTPEPGRLDRAG